MLPIFVPPQVPGSSPEATSLQAPIHALTTAASWSQGQGWTGLLHLPGLPHEMALDVARVYLQH